MQEGGCEGIKSGPENGERRNKLLREKNVQKILLSPGKEESMMKKHKIIMP